MACQVCSQILHAWASLDEQYEERVYEDTSDGQLSETVANPGNTVSPDQGGREIQSKASWLVCRFSP